MKVNWNAIAEGYRKRARERFDLAHSADLRGDYKTAAWRRDYGRELLGEAHRYEQMARG